MPLRLVASGQADGVFELALPFTVEPPVDPQAALGAGRFHGKVLIVNSAAEDSGNLVDAGAHPDQYRVYAVAGTPHVSDPLVPLFSNQTTPASWIPALRAHFLQGHRWVRNRVTPPPSSTVDHGPHLPFVALGEAVFHPGFLGSYDNVKTVTQLGFATHRAYARAFNALSVAPLSSDGLLIPLRFVRLHTCEHGRSRLGRVCGRGVELARLLAALERADRGMPQVVLLAGDAGVGKTRLLSRFIDRAKQGGGCVLAGGCVELGDIGLAYLPIVDALAGLAEQAADAELLAEGGRDHAWPGSVAARDWGGAAGGRHGGRRRPGAASVV